MYKKAVYTDRKLTEQEKKFAEDHHDLMYRYMRVHKLDVEEWYDRLIIPYLQAVKKYHEIEKLKELEFEQVFFRTLDSARGNYFRDSNRKKRKPEGGIVSLDLLLEGYSRYQINKRTERMFPYGYDMDDLDDDVREFRKVFKQVFGI